jgi:predicted TIM-barrel fold metal-dependent hydrolase
VVGVRKILFGTDFPLILPGRYFQELETSGLSREDQERILGLNFANLIGL